MPYKMFVAYIMAIFYSSVAYAYPAEATAKHSSSHIQKRNPCDGKDAEPILYHDYKNDVCPPPNTFESPGYCKMKRYKETSWNPFSPMYCGGYCEENVRFFYGRESIFLSSPYCHGPMTCTISETKTTGWNFQGQVPLGYKFKDVFSAGITGSFQYTSSTAKATTKQVKLEQGECGYFTWIPILRESCGTFTGNGKYKDIAPGHPEGLCYDGESTPNVCTTLANVARGSKDDPWGITVLVRVDCGTHEPLPPESKCISRALVAFTTNQPQLRPAQRHRQPYLYIQTIPNVYPSLQDPAYTKPGVPLDRGVYNSFAETFEKKPEMQGLSSEIDCSFQDASKMAQFEDCSAALATGMMRPIVGLLRGRNGGQWWASYVHSCAFQIEYEQDWAEDCLVGLTEVLVAASEIMNTCKVQDGKIGGARKLRTDGKCNATVRLANTAGREAPQDESPLIPKDK